MNFEELVNRHKDAVYRQMLRVCGNRQDAEDVLMEALLKAYRSLEQLREPETFRAWLAQIARRVCWQLRQREALAPLLQLSEMGLQAEPVQPGEPLDMELARREIKELLWQAIDQLPEELREVYLLRDVEDLGGIEVASRLGISLAAMKSRLHRARSVLREKIDAAMQSASGE